MPNKFLARVKERMGTHKMITCPIQGIYGRYDLVNDAEVVGIKLSVDRRYLKPIEGGFALTCNATYDGLEQILSIIMVPGTYIVSSSAAEDGLKILKEGFGKLFDQPPNVMYRNLIDGPYAAEWYLDAIENENAKFIHAQIESIKSDSSYEVLDYRK